MDQHYILNVGLKRFGVKGEHVVTSEIKHLHDMETFEHLNANKLTNKYRAYSLSSLVFLTEKWMSGLKVEHVPMV